MTRAVLVCSVSLAAALQPPRPRAGRPTPRVSPRLSRTGEEAPGPRSPASIIAAPSARELERVAPQLISADDSVLCAGLALGSQIELLQRLANRVVAVDVPRKESRSRRELFQSDAVNDFRPLTRAGDVTAALRPDECFDCVVIDAAALLGFDLPLDTLALCEALRRRQETPPTILVRSSALATLGRRSCHLTHEMAARQCSEHSGG